MPRVSGEDGRDGERHPDGAVQPRLPHGVPGALGGHQLSRLQVHAPARVLTPTPARLRNHNHHVIPPLSRVQHLHIVVSRVVTLCAAFFKRSLCYASVTSHCLLVATARFAQTPEAAADNACFECQSHESLWICLVCGHVGCGRYVERHAFAHFQVSLDVQYTPATQAKRETTFEVCVHMFYVHLQYV